MAPTSRKHLMKMLAAVLLLVCAPVAAQAADNFTFTTTGKTVDGVRVPAQGASFQGAQVTSFSTDVAYADGKKETVGGKCAVWKNPPNAQFDQSGVCTSPSLYTMQYSCQPDQAKIGLECWGYLIGAAEGRYKGRTGLVTYHSSAKGIAGVGRWND
jgi:hypothetical protein